MNLRIICIRRWCSVIKCFREMIPCKFAFGIVWFASVVLWRIAGLDAS